MLELLGAKIVIKDDHSDVVVFAVLADLLEFARAYVAEAVGGVEALQEAAPGVGSGGEGKEGEFVEVFAGVLFVLPGGD